MIELGRKYRDRMTGFEGIASGYVAYLSGCNQVLLVPRVKADGTLAESHWFDEQRLEAVGDEVIRLVNISNGFDATPPKW